jgi:hypothetical protein
LLLQVTFFLARNTSPHASHGLAPCFWNHFGAIDTFEQAFAVSELTARAFDGVVDAGVNLILNSPVFSPASSHARLPDAYVLRKIMVARR